MTKDMTAAGINPILAATNGATSTPSGSSASIGSQRYNQQSAQAASVSAMYEYGNNTAELADKYLQLAKQATSAKQLKSAKSWEQAASELATSSAKQAQQYTYTANKLGAGLAGAGKAAKDAAEKASKAAKETAGNFKKYNKKVPIVPNMDVFGAISKIIGKEYFHTSTNFYFC